MKLATWNVNSIRARKDRLSAWVDAVRPDVLCLQELKVPTEDMPGELAAAGYHVAAWGQKSYNGVAIASRAPLVDVTRGFTAGPVPGTDEQARVIAATIDGIRVVCLYVPNGEALDSDKYAYKLGWYRELRGWLDAHHQPDAPLVVCGDMNVAPTDLDVHDPDAWRGRVHCSQPERDALAHVLGFGLVDVFRHHHPDTKAYSWWDYRGVDFFKDRGLRIDHVFATAPVVATATGARIDRDARKGKDASDHAPVIVDLR
jgi:exodeoxyribonuclease-3